MLRIYDVRMFLNFIPTLISTCKDNFLLGVVASRVLLDTNVIYMYVYKGVRSVLRSGWLLVLWLGGASDFFPWWTWSLQGVRALSISLEKAEPLKRGGLAQGTLIQWLIHEVKCWDYLVMYRTSAFGICIRTLLHNWKLCKLATIY